MNLTDDQFTTWMKALRSSDYEQTHGALVANTARDPDNPNPPPVYSFCCMGVCGVAVFHVPFTTLEWYPFLSHPMVDDQRVKYVFTEEEELVLSRLNDAVRLTFSQIAAFVEGGGLTHNDVTEALLRL